jgi:hypothetical protein
MPKDTAGKVFARVFARKPFPFKCKQDRVKSAIPVHPVLAYFFVVGGWQSLSVCPKRYPKSPFCWARVEAQTPLLASGYAVKYASAG